MNVPALVFVVPCFNEAERLDGEALLSFSQHAGLLFVNDGSTDATEARLRALQARAPERIEVLSLAANGGKAEAVRQGMLRAVQRGAEVVGYFDADLSTPVAELRRLAAVMAERRPEVVMGSRVALLGSEIHRSPSRHYLGRIFASAASLMLGLRVYDTQCGAKLFRRSPALEQAIAEPFLSRWAFDVELIGRLLAGGHGVAPIGPSGFLEVPLGAWRDVPGSKLRPAAMAGAARDLVVIASDLRRRRGRRQPR